MGWDVRVVWELQLAQRLSVSVTLASMYASSSGAGRLKAVLGGHQIHQGSRAHLALPGPRWLVPWPSSAGVRPEACQRSRLPTVPEKFMSVSHSLR